LSGWGWFGDAVTASDPRSRQECRAEERRISPVVEPPASELVTVDPRYGRGKQLHRDAYSAYQRLKAGAEADGIPANLLTVVSGYRSVALQQRLWQDALRKYGSPQAARKWVAPPGGSPHHTGRAIDFYLGGRNNSENVTNLRRTDAYRWLVCNAVRFGFFPYAAEPWHWEYNPPAGQTGPGVAAGAAAAMGLQGLGWFGCGPTCGCADCCRASHAGPGLGERYIEDKEVDQPTLPKRSKGPAPPVASPAPEDLSGWGWFGEQLPSGRRVSLGGDVQLRMPAFETITGFARGGADLSAAQTERVNRVAGFISRSWTGDSPITSVRVTGYIDRSEWQSDLGQQRAVGVRNALVSALTGVRPELATRLRWITEDRGFSPMAKVEIYLWAGPTPPPVPPLVRVPSPAEAARTAVPMRPETPEERIQRILRTPMPSPPKRRSFSRMFWQQVDERLEPTMSRLGVPQSLRKPIRDGVHAAIQQGSEALLNQVVQASGLPAETQEAIRGTSRALLQVPVE
jgi:outer membrane protein OmpA-like peptidoglycan-associated protein